MSDTFIEETAEVKTPAKSGIFNRAKYAYQKNGVKTPSGRPAVDNGDALAVAIRGKNAAECIALVEENGEEVPARWAELNIGMQRMNASNVLRRLAKSEEGVKIDGQTIRLEPKETAQAA